MRRNIVDGSLVTSKAITRHIYGIRAIAVSPDDRFVASLSLQHRIHINSLDPSEGFSEIVPATPSQRCTRIDFSPDGKRLYFCKQSDSGENTKKEPNQFVVWDVASGKAVFASAAKSLRTLGPVDASSDGLYVAIGAHHHIQLFDTNRNDFSRAIPVARSLVLDVAYSPNNQFLAVASRDGTLTVLDVGVGGAHHRYETAYQVRHHSESLNAIAWIDDATLLTGDDGGRILLHNLRSSLDPAEEYASQICRLQSDGKHLVVIDSSGNASIADLRDGEIVCKLEGMRRDPPLRVKLDQQADLLALSYGNQLQIWNLRNRRPQTTVTHHVTTQLQPDATSAISEIDFAPDGNLIATIGGVDGTAIVWDSKSGKVKKEFTIDTSGMGLLVSFSPDGKKLLCSTSTSSLIYDLVKAKTFPVDTPLLAQAKWLSESIVLISSQAGLLATYDVDNRKLVSVFSNQSGAAQHLACSPDLRSLVTTDVGEMQFWNMPTGRLIGSVPIQARSIAFSPDGSQLYIASEDATSHRCELRVVSMNQ